MNAATHVVANLLLLRRGAPENHLPIVCGALLPDLPMVFFYCYAKALGYSERLIWNELYFAPAWQISFDVFNSIPIFLVLGLSAWRLSKLAVTTACSSALLHCLFDLLLHREDAHRHFLPFSDFRFLSPVSYWDPTHGGSVFLAIEAAILIGGIGFLWQRLQTTFGKGCLATLVSAQISIVAWWLI